MNSSITSLRETASEQGGDECARQEDLYQSAVAELGSALGRIALAYEANPAQQQDLLQEIHFALWRSLAAFKGNCSLRTWVYRVAHNTATSYSLRNKRRRASKWISLEDFEGAVEPIDSARSADEESVRERMMKLIRSLRAIDRDILLLYLEGVAIKEIGEIVGLTPSNVAQKIHRGKKILMTYFGAGADHDT